MNFFSTNKIINRFFLMIHYFVYKKDTLFNPVHSIYKTS